MPYERYTYACPGGPNIVSFRCVRPRYPWLAGSSWSYASTSTMRPPTPSTRSVTPIRSGATSCTLRAKKSRGIKGSSPPRVVLEQRRDREPDQEAAGDTQDAAGDDREAHFRERRDDACLEVADPRRARDLREVGGRDPALQSVRCRREHHGVPQHRAYSVC